MLIKLSEPRPDTLIFIDMSEDVLKNMRERAAKCRRLARSVLDKDASTALDGLADEIEADIKRLQHQSPS